MHDFKPPHINVFRYEGQQDDELSFEQDSYVFRRCAFVPVIEYTVTR